MDGDINSTIDVKILKQLPNFVKYIYITIIYKTKNDIFFKK